VLTVVTAIFGPKFKLHEPAGSWPKCRFVCFTDRVGLKSDTWQIIQQPHALSPRRSNRHVKALLHRYVAGPTLYIDAEFQVTGDPYKLVPRLLKRRSWAATRHPQRDCLFDEGAVCLEKGRVESPAELEAQLARYRAAGMPRHFGLWAGNVIARQGDAASARLGEAWWKEIEAGSERDQVSLPFVAWKLGLRPGLARKKLERKYQ
jgi:hypothetical protein